MTTELITANLRDALRHETAPLHDQLERRVRDAGCFETARAYRQWLRKMHRLHAHFGADHDEGCRRLGLVPLSARLCAALSQDVGLPVAATAPGRLSGADPRGVAYVFEGSAQGARLLLRSLEPLEPVPDAYLRTLVAASASRWPRVKAECARTGLAGPASHDAAVIAARSVFDAFLAAFAEDAP